MFRSVVCTIALMLAVHASVGCVPRTVVKKNPNSWDKGVRYYRPKPYLKLAPHLVKEAGKDALTHDPTSIEISLEYLPDFSEEYSIHVKSGFGSNNTSISLADGWNLTSLNVHVDSQTDENIAAVGSLLQGAAGLAKDALPSVPGDKFVVKATNVPMGYYESVIGVHCGKKQLYGFRYVGFMPYAACPQLACGGAEPFNCEGDLVYGLVFESGVMTFKSLGSVQALSAKEGLNQFKSVKAIAAESSATGDEVPAAEVGDLPAPLFSN